MAGGLAVRLVVGRSGQQRPRADRLGRANAGSDRRLGGDLWPAE